MGIAVSVSGLQQWNTLQTEHRQARVKFEHFKHQLKTFLFRDHGVLLRLVDIGAFKNLLTYLLMSIQIHQTIHLLCDIHIITIT